jgi:hypothetical protein
MRDSLKTGICWGAFEVLHAESYFLKEDGKTPMMYFCLPPNVGRVQMIQVFLRCANEHPEKLHWDFTAAAMNSLVQAFPCK